MDYGKLLRRAWEITWRWKILWVLGLLVSLGQGGSNFQMNYSYGSPEEMPDWLRDLVMWRPAPELLALLIGLGCLALLVGLALWVVGIIARGGLIAGVWQVEEEGATSFLRSWRVGVRRSWSLLGIAVLTFLPLLIVVLGIFLLAVAVAVAAGGVGGRRALPPLTGLLCCGGPLLVCGTILGAIVLAQIRIYAENAAILEGLGWIDAFRRGWQVLRDHLGPTLVIWAIFFGIGIVLVFILLGIAAPFGIPIAALVGSSDPSTWPWALIVTGGLVLFVVGLFARSVLQTFSTATWTLAYRELTGLQSQLTPSPRPLPPTPDSGR